MNICDIKNKLVKVIDGLDDNPAKKIASDIIEEEVSVVNPEAGVVVKGIKSLLDEYQKFKLNILLKAYAKGLNTETCKNELVNYINKSSSNVFNVAELFRKTVSADSPNIIIIYGIILANHLRDMSSFSFEELIVFKALDNCNDFDLKLIQDLFSNCVHDCPDGKKKIELDSNMGNYNDLLLICEWGSAFRLFKDVKVEFDSDGLSFVPKYYVEKPAELLYEYIMELPKYTIWD